MFRNTGVSIHYYSCNGCGHIWTTCLDDWSDSDFRRNIYNEDYALADPPFTYERPARNAALIDDIVGRFRDSLTILDWGGGNGLMARMLAGRGFQNVTSYDPFYGDNPLMPGLPFDLVTCFEVVEHVPDQRTLFTDVVSHVAPHGALLFSTLVQPADIQELRLGWWYARPRNGHIRLHSRKSLEVCLSREGLRLKSLSDEMHVAFRDAESPLVKALLAAEVHEPSQPPAPSLAEYS